MNRLANVAMCALQLIGRVLRAIFYEPPCRECARLPEGFICRECAWWRAIK